MAGFERDKLALLFDVKKYSSEMDHSRASSWKGFSAEVVDLGGVKSYEFRGGNPGHHYLAYHDLVRADGEWEVGGESASNRKDIREMITYIPKQLDFKGWVTLEQRKNTIVALTFDPHLIGKELESLFPVQMQSPHVYFKNQNIKSTMLKIGSLLKQASSYPSMYMETLGLSAVLELAMVLTNEAFTQKRGGLGRSQELIVAEYIKANLTKDMTLDELASLVQMSRFHFSRSFKETFGVSPIRYINRERVTFAKSVLLTSRASITEISETLGFGSIQNFIRTFREITGVTPLEFRRGS
ncbi:AraC family transcriptional regulator [Agrobacterium leguminum]|uniref:helix-turn-helix transcriptional regulator n=1 Tax=Agrobacterium leguminum TaxID=2792015 RepID=UPI0022B84EC7|nr:AraC family transcriptional regulator [Agrobacterium leguminum]MCZ7935723.1 AraC family transcriptional regulator [Agrobacterium leguminum]